MTDRPETEDPKAKAAGGNALTRRRLLRVGTAMSGIALLQAGGQGGAARASWFDSDEDDPTKTPGAGPSEVGKRAPAVSLERRTLYDAASTTPLQHLSGTITPADLHFERHHAGIPRIDAATHSLLIHGMVERPLTFTLKDLKRLPSVTRICFVECSGNFGVIRGAPEKSTPQVVHGLTSQSEWTGVALSTLFREAGVKDAATWFLAEGGDAAVMTRSVPVDRALAEGMIAYAQNGEPVRPEQGYPFRLLLPGWEGNMSVKWLRRIELADRPFMTREETSKYTEPMKGGWARQFSFDMDAKSIITRPAFPNVIEKGWVRIEGIAWSGWGRIRAVEISVDGGKNWRKARLPGPVLSKAHTRFEYMWDWPGGEAVIMSRAIDETGLVQPAAKDLIASRGIGSRPYHLNPVIGWRVRKSGEVFLDTSDLDLRLPSKRP